MSTINELRAEKKLTQQQVAAILGISLRSYKSYEIDADKVGSLKYNYIIDRLSAISPIDEEHGKAVESSDVDLLVSSDVKGLKFYDMVEKLRAALHKKVDVLSLEQL